MTINSKYKNVKLNYFDKNSTKISKVDTKISQTNLKFTVN